MGVRTPHATHAAHEHTQMNVLITVPLTVPLGTALHVHARPRISRDEIKARGLAAGAKPTTAAVPTPWLTLSQA